MADSAPLLQLEGGDIYLFSRKRHVTLQKPLFFYHIPKTAGLTFRHVISFAQEYRYETKRESHLAGNKGSVFPWNADIPPKYLEQKFCSVVAWRPFGFHEKFHQSFNLVTATRYPFDRVVSRYRYICVVKGQSPSTKEFERFFRDTPQINHQSKLLAGEGDHAESSISLFDRARENLGQFYAYTTMENMNTLLENLLGAYNLPNVIGQRSNVAQAWTRFDYEPYRDEIMDLNRYDNMVFDYVHENQKLCSEDDDEKFGLLDGGSQINELTVVLRKETEPRHFSWMGFPTEQLVEDFRTSGIIKKELEAVFRQGGASEA